MSAPYREIRYERPLDPAKAFEQLLLAVLDCREAQNKFDNNFGYENRRRKFRKQLALDSIINKYLNNQEDHLPTNERLC